MPETGTVQQTPIKFTVTAAGKKAVPETPATLKRKRGRPRLYPRDELGNVIKPPTTEGDEQPSAKKEKKRPRLEPVGIIPAKRATRGKVPLRYQADEFEDEAKEETEEEAKQRPVRPGRPPKHPPPVENNGNPDVTVNISVKDKSCTQFLGTMGVYILYYCRKCAFSSKHMTDVTDHIKAGEHMEQPADAMEAVYMENDQVESFISEPLVTDALTEVAKDDLLTIVAQNRVIRNSNKYVKVEEHSYAEVTIEAVTAVEQSIEEDGKGESNAGATELDTQDADITHDAEAQDGTPEALEEPEDEGILTDDSADDPDFTANESTDEEDYVIEEDDEENNQKSPKKRGRKRTRFDMEGTLDPSNAGEDSDLEEDPMVPRRYKCLKCFYTIFYSLTDYREHRKCHGRSGNTTLHCYQCRLTGKRRVMAGSSWTRIKSHLALNHNINFKLQCPSCPSVLSQHTRFFRHYKSHLHSCKYDFCRFDCAQQQDMDLHLRCHQESNTRYYSCPICEFSHKTKPWKWPLVHSHIISKHPGEMCANFTCRTCNEGFFDTNAYIDHKRTCGKDVYIKCDLCNEDIPKIKLIKHAVEHVRQMEGQLQDQAPSSESQLAPSSEETEVSDLQRLAEEAERQAMESQSDNHTDSQVKDSTDKPTTKTQVSVGSEPQKDEEQQAVVKVIEKTIIIEPQTGEEYKCIEHDQVFASASDLTLHYVQVHWGIDQQQMDAASRELDRREEEKQLLVKAEIEDEDIFTQLRQMEWQASKSGKGKGYERCDHCYKKFASFPRLFRHIQRCHTGEKLNWIRCQACHKDFKNRSQYRNHYRVVHEGIKRKKPDTPYKPRSRLFICELCGYSTPENIRLKNHRLSAHLGIMPYVCGQCDYKTNEKSDLRRHMAKHSGQKRYKCDYCAYSTDQRWLLVNHCLRQHDVRLPLKKRNTRGTYWSNRKKQDGQMEEVIVQGGENLEYATLDNIISLQAVQNGEEVTVLMTAGEDYTENTEEAIAVEALQEGDETGQVVYVRESKEDDETSQVVYLQESKDDDETSQVVYVQDVQESKEGEETNQVVYVREDGTILDPEEAAMMLYSVEDEDGQQVIQYESSEQVEHGQQPIIIMQDGVEIEEAIAETIDLGDPNVIQHVQVIEDSTVTVNE